MARYVGSTANLGDAAEHLHAYVLPGAVVYSDEWPGYNTHALQGRVHHRVRHAAKVYVDGDVHTQAIEGFWSLLKRGISGTYHSVSDRYLQSYIDEYAFRYNPPERPTGDVLRLPRERGETGAMTVSDDLLLEQSYQVARGVRALAIVGHWRAETDEMHHAHTRLHSLGDPAAIPFVFAAEGVATYGYAREAWAIDLLQWASSPEVPPARRAEITGLLLGYSPEDVGRFRQRESGLRF